MSKHIGVIGSGIIGLVVARDLARAGFQVTVLHDGQAASWCAPGVNCIKGLFLGEKDLFRRKISGHHRLWTEIQSLQAIAGTDLEMQKGVLEPIVDLEDLKTRSDRAFHGRFLGLYGTRLLPTGEPHSVEELNSAYRGLLFHPDDYSFHPGKTLKALEAMNDSLGCRFINAFVHTIQRKDNGYNLSLSCSTELNVDDLVIAAGSGSLPLLNKLGVSTSDFKLKAGISLEAQSKLNHVFKIGSFSGVSKNGRLRFGAKDFLLPTEKKESLLRSLQTSNHLPCQNSLSESFFQTYTDQLHSSLEKITPHFSNPNFSVGVRLDGPQGKPFVTRTMISGQPGPIIATGFHKSAWSLAWETGERVLTLLNSGV